MLSGGYRVGSMTRYVGNFNPVGNSMYAGMSSVFGGATGAVYRMTQRVARQEALYGYSRYGYSRYGYGGSVWNRAFAQAAERFRPRYAPEARNNSSSAAPQQAQQGQRAGGSNQANASGASKTSPEEARRKQKEANNETRHDNAVESLKKLRGDPEGESDAAREGTAVSSLMTAKGYSKDEATKIVAMINKMVPMGFDGDPVRAEAALKKYQNYLSGVPGRKNGKGDKIPHAEWAAKYAEWLGGMKGVKPSNAAQIPISDVMGVTGKGKRKKISKNKAKHALLVSIGLETTKGGKVYDAYRVYKSTDTSVVPNNATLVRDGDKKWFILKDGALTAINRGKRGDPIFDERGILNIDPRYKEIRLVPNKKKGADAGDINGAVEAWIANNPQVKTKHNSADKRAEHVKKALEKKLQGRFTSSVVSVSAKGKNVKITILGDQPQLSKRAKAVAAYMEADENKSYFTSVLGDLAQGAVIQIQKEATRVGALQDGTFSGVVSEIKKLSTHVTLPVIDVRKFDGAGKDTKPNAAHVETRVKAHGEDPAKVVGKKVVVKLRYVKDHKPDDAEKKKIEKFVKKHYAKDGRTVEVELVKGSAAKPSEYADKKKRAALKERLVAALWDGDYKVKSKADAEEAVVAMIEAAEGTVGSDKKDNKRLVPVPFATFEKSVGVKLRKHADDMRKKVVAAKGDKAMHDGLMKAYTAWWGVAGKYFSGVSADYYKPDTVKNVHPRTAVVQKSKRKHGPRRARVKRVKCYIGGASAGKCKWKLPNGNIVWVKKGKRPPGY